MSKKKFTDEQILEALESNHGRLAPTARELKCTRMTLWKYMQNEELKIAADNFRKMGLQFTLSQLDEAVESGEAWAIKESLNYHLRFHLNKTDSDNIPKLNISVS